MSDILSLFNLTFLVFTVLLFLRAAYHKVSDFTEFQGFVADYELVPEPLVKPVAAFLAAAEAGLVLLMLVPATRTLGLVAAALLLAGYGMAIMVNLRRGRRQVECGCGGAPQLLSGSLIARNLVLALVALSPALTGIPEHFNSQELIAAIVAALTLSAFYALFEQANANHQAIRTR